jgi:hypothetical protein
VSGPARASDATYIDVHSGLMTAARLKALGVSCLIVERNSRIGDNWRNRYDALSLHLPHWADHFPYMPYPEHWPMFCPAAKLGDFFEWYASAMELFVWTSSSVKDCTQDKDGQWTIEVERAGNVKETRVLHPKQLVRISRLPCSILTAYRSWPPAWPACHTLPKSLALTSLGAPSVIRLSTTALVNGKASAS